MNLSHFEEAVKALASFTCECNCVTFDKDRYGIPRCRLCKKKYKYGELDYDAILNFLTNLKSTFRKDVVEEIGKTIDNQDLWDAEKSVLKVEVQSILNKFIGGKG